MAIAELVLKYFAVVIWPAVVLVAIVVFRMQLASLFSRITEATVPGATLKFAQEAKEAATLSEAIPDPPEPGPEGAPKEQRFQPVLDQVLMAWIEVEVSANSAIGRVSQGRFRGNSQIFDELRRSGFISPDTWRVARQLRDLRNRLVHTGDVNLTAAAADDFVTASHKLVKILNSIGDPSLTSGGTLSA